MSKHVTWGVAKLEPHDASGVENPEQQMWYEVNGIYYPAPVRKNSPQSIRNEIAPTQDGGKLDRHGRFNEFINECIDYNTEGYTGDNSREVNVPDLIDDFNYMIDQLKKAIVPLKNL